MAKPGRLVARTARRLVNVSGKPPPIPTQDVVAALGGQSLISLNQAAARGIERIRQTNWTDPFDHYQIDIIDGRCSGIWIHLYGPLSHALTGRDPQDLLILGWDLDAPHFVPYDGPLPDSPEYRAKADHMTATFPAHLKPKRPL